MRGKTVGNYETLNELLVTLFRDVMDIEQKVIITPEFKDITNNDMHVIEAIGIGEPKNMSSIARELSVTVGTLTIAMNSLVKKGYVERIQSTTDKREYRLRPTQKYIDYYNISYSYLHLVMERAKQRFGPDDLAKLEEMLQVVSDELMPEIQLPE